MQNYHRGGNTADPKGEETTMSAKCCKPFLELLETIKTLRGPAGCPWDMQQTPLSMRTYLLEEVYEALEAINSEKPTHIMEELGDVLLIIGMLSHMYA